MYVNEKLSLILFLFVISILLNGCGDGNSGGSVPTPVSKINFSGRVMDKTTGKSLAGVTLTTNKGDTVTSDSNGNFNIKLNAGTTCIINTNASGYNGNLTGGFIPSEDINNYEIFISPVNSNEKPVIKDI
jgi:hypothetical protein